MYKHFIKRAADLIIAFIAAVMLIPVWLILSLLIVIDDRGSVFFVQKRVGKGKKLFPILKFRTMKTKTPHDTPTHLLSDPDQYITRVGRFLRKTSLDELPQLFNIIAGTVEPVRPHRRARQIRRKRHPSRPYGACPDKRQGRASDTRKSPS